MTSHLPRPSRDKSISPLSKTQYNILASASAGLVARTITHPLDTLKTQIQSSPSPLRLSSLIKTSTARSLYKGLAVSLVFSVPAVSLFLASYDYFKLRLAPRLGEDTFLTHAGAGALAECVSGVLWTPMENIKNKLQVGERRVWQRLIRSEGVGGLFKGYWLGLATFVPYSVTYFLVYERLKRILVPGLSKTQSKLIDPSPTQTPSIFLAATISGAIAGAVSNIFDVVKTRTQVTRRSNVIDEIYRTQGLRGFLVGMLPRVMWVTPSVAITMTIYDSVKWRGDNDSGSEA